MNVSGTAHTGLDAERAPYRSASGRLHLVRAKTITVVVSFEKLIPSTLSIVVSRSAVVVRDWEGSI